MIYVIFPGGPWYPETPAKEDENQRIGFLPRLRHLRRSFASVLV